MSYAAQQALEPAAALNANVVLTPPVTIWPVVDRRIELPPDVEEVVAALELEQTLERWIELEEITR